uniref:Uncharacterized protein n=1 Tax=Cucumis melo TaxID=3656 RepID=A0A9I9DK24_CUCME
MLSLKFGSKWVAVATSESLVGRQRHLRSLCCFSNRIHSNGLSSQYQIDVNSPLSSKHSLSLEGLEDVMAGYFFGKKKATEVAHSEELETIENFSSDLAVENWICCKLQMLNRPLAPVPVFLFKR